MEFTEKLKRLEKTGKIDGLDGGAAEVGRLLDFFNSEVDKAKDKELRHNIEGLNDYYKNLYVRDMLKKAGEYYVKPISTFTPKSEPGSITVVKS